MIEVKRKEPFVLKVLLSEYYSDRETGWVEFVNPDQVKITKSVHDEGPKYSDWLYTFKGKKPFRIVFRIHKKDLETGLVTTKKKIIWVK